MGRPQMIAPGVSWLRTRLVRRTVGYRAFDPATDTHADAVECQGVRGAKRVEMLAVEGGEVKVTRSSWQLVGLAARPVLRSLVVDGSDTWVVDDAEGDPPPRDGVFGVRVTLA